MGRSAKKTEIVPGGHVRFKGSSEFRLAPGYYPKPGTVGVVVDVCRDGAWVQWPAGSIENDALHYNTFDLLEVAKAPARPWRLMAAVAGLCVAAMILAAMAYGRVMALQLLEAACDLAGAAACLHWGADVDRQVQAVLDVRRNMGAGRY